MVQRGDVTYTARERLWFGVLAAFGFVGVNGVFLYTVLLEPGGMGATLRDPLAAAFIAEALVLMGVLAYLLARWKVSQVHWAWFVVLSLVGSIAFALPVVLLLSWRREQAARRSAGGPGQST